MKKLISRNGFKVLELTKQECHLLSYDTHDTKNLVLCKDCGESCGDVIYHICAYKSNICKYCYDEFESDRRIMLHSDMIEDEESWMQKLIGKLNFIQKYNREDELQSFYITYKENLDDYAFKGRKIDAYSLLDALEKWEEICEPSFQTVAIYNMDVLGKYPSQVKPYEL